MTACHYDVPDYWTIGEVYERLIEDISGDDEEHLIPRMIEVYSSWIDAAISDYNTDFYYQPRDYICECWREGKVCEEGRTPADLIEANQHCQNNWRLSRWL